MSGCKKNTVKKWAERGSWVIGIGGVNTGKPNKLIYAMEVEENLPYEEFKRKYPDESRYLQPCITGLNILISKKFYYFGSNAIDLPKNLKHIIIHGRGCKRITDDDINKLMKYLEGRYRCGKRGTE
ncbi:hypothetical protein KEJ20_03060 [Candidatus Bathyarchaeota archaeon]|nr:hypothetical protein [Candidatus Bathyarchaeota archaeon]